jgi:FAD/FMN-containing dehydrogenase
MPKPSDTPAFTGSLVLRGDRDFEKARTARIFNQRMAPRQPAAVLFAHTEQDVVAGVLLARGRGWKVAVRAGGHSWAQWSLRDEALVIDLENLKEISYDKSTGVVSVSPAVQGGQELDPYLAERGRFFNGGHCPTVGVGGFLLQGGQGWNARGWGWAAERIVAIDVVTAAGELVHADCDINSDLYWAARGGGPGFFGVVTRFHLQTLPRPQHFAHTVQIYEAGDFDEVMTWLQGMHRDVDSNVEIVAIGMTLPVPDGTTPELAPRAPVLVVTALAFVDDQRQALEVLAPFEACPAIDRAVMRQHAKPSSLAEQREEQYRANPPGHRWRVDNAWLDGSPAEVVPLIRGAFLDLPNDKAFSIWFSMAPLRELPDMAFSLQSEIYFAIYTLWEDPLQDSHFQAWVAARMKAVEPITVGQYLGDSDLAQRQVKFMADENWNKFNRIRRLRDPQSLFVGYLAGTEGATNRNHWQ